MKHSYLKIVEKHLFFILVCIPIAGFANQFYVSPSGSNTGTGSLALPWDLQTAFNQPSSVLPNDTLWLRGGTYAGNFTSNLNGASNQYIYVLQYPNERAKIEDNRQFASGATLQVNGSWTIYKGFEISNSNTTRTSSSSSVFRPMGLQVVAPNTKFINLVIHDVGHGFGFWKEAVDAEIYGCLIYNCGIANSPGNYSTHGHGIYTQNNTGLKKIKDNLIFNQFGFGIHAYPNPGNVNGYVIEGNTIFNNGIQTHDTVRYSNILVNPYPPYTANDIVIQNNHTYDSKNAYTYTALIEADLFVGATNVNCSRLKIENNYFMGKGRAGGAILQWDTVTFRNNTTYYRKNGSAAIVLPSGGNYTKNLWDGNTYFGSSFASQFSYQYGPLVNFTNWKTTTGFDAGSTFSASNPSSTQVVIQPNQYESGRANLIVYNWGLLSTVSIDLTTAGLVDGQNFKLVDAQNYFGTPLYTGAFSSSSPSISIGLSGLTPVAAHGMAAVPSTAPEFATFVVVPEGQVSSIGSVDSDGASFKIFPNPAEEEVQISGLVAGQIKQMDLVDLSGKLLKSSINSDKLTLKEVQKGICLIHIRLKDNSTITKKIIKN